MAGAATGYSNVKNRAKRTECESNLKQIAQFVQMYDMTNGKYPDAAFFPKNPEKDSRSLRKILEKEGAPKQLFICPTAPPELKKLGLTFIWNDSLSNQRSGRKKEWLMVEMNAVAPDKAPPPHQGGYHILWTDFSVTWVQSLPGSLTDAIKKASK